MVPVVQAMHHAGYDDGTYNQIGRQMLSTGGANDAPVLAIFAHY